MMRATSAILCLLACCCRLTRGADVEGSAGIQAYNQGRYASALALLKKATEHGSDVQTRIYLALTEVALNDCPAALGTLMDGFKNSSSELKLLSGLAAAKCYSAEGNSAAATAILSDLARQNPNNADVLYLTAKVEMKAFNDATFAMFQRTPSSYRVHQLSGEILETQSRFKDAAAEYRKAIELNGTAPDLHYRLGRVLLLGEHSSEALAEASQAFEAELAISPEDAASEFQLGQLAQVGGHSAEARAYFERALQMSPRFMNAAVALGKLYVNGKQYDKAIALLKQAVIWRPENETAHYVLLTAYRDAGQVDNARAEKNSLDRLQKPPEGEFSDFLKKLGEKPPDQ